MNYNIAAYAVFVALMVFLIVYVGRYFYTNGRIFILSLFGGNAPLADSVNTILLAGYYLLNIGYAFLRLRGWPPVTDLESGLSTLSTNAGGIILILAFIHYFNMLGIYLLSKSNFITHKYFNHE